MKRAELWRSVKFLLFSCSAGLIELGSFALFNEVLHWPYWAAYLLALVMLRCYGISRATGTIILPFPAASQACVWGRRDWVRHEMQRTLFATKTPCRSKQSGKGFAQIV